MSGTHFQRYGTLKHIFFAVACLQLSWGRRFDALRLKPLLLALRNAWHSVH